MIDQGEKIESSIRHALKLLEELSSLSEDQWDVTAYKKALLCRMEIQYSMAVMKLNTKTDDPPRAVGRSKIDVSTAIRLLKSLTQAPPSEKILEDLQQVDLFMGRTILAMRRRLKANLSRKHM
ncbi:MAG: hypothetical protein N3D12_02985 [Candidatus Methanomethyliaceae archaeon]|nr:hypothetical protein [Candidatus Methanomethyliaceae archaeon]